MYIGIYYRKDGKGAMNQTRNGLKGAIALFMAAFIWGVAFVAQSKGGEAMDAFTFNATRFVMGGLALIPLILFFRSRMAFTRSRKAAFLLPSRYIKGNLCLLCWFSPPWRRLA